MTQVMQLFDKESGTYTYIVHGDASQEAVIIDSVKRNVSRDLKEISELGLTLKYVLDTHVHADHITGAYDVKKATGAKIVLGSKNAAVKFVDVFLDDEEELVLADFTIKALHTPGHTDGCATYVIDEALFTGDTLLIRSVGRTDFQAGSADTLFTSIRKLYSFPDNTVIYPAHNYDGLTRTSVGEEKTYNAFVQAATSREEFIKKTIERKLPLPKRIDVAVPANMVSGEAGVVQ